jgi:acetyltransferase
MTVPRLSAAGRFNPACLFRPTSVAVIGGNGAEIAAHLAMGGFQGAIEVVARPEDLTAAPDVAAIATPEADVIPTMEGLAAKGCFAAIVPGPATGLTDAARRTGVRVLGPNAFGLAVPGIGLNASQAHIPVPKGRLALVSQSLGLTRAVLDWAGPNGVGFSHVIGIGGNADVGYGMALDWLSQDSATGAILLEIGHIRDRRAFLSAARAASRYRPVVAFRSGPFPPDPLGTAALAFEAALRRAGVLTVGGLDDMLAAAETLSRARPARGETLAVLAADPGAGSLAVEVAAHNGLRVNQAVLDTLANLGTDKTIGGVLKVHTPGEPIDVGSLAAQARIASVPLLVCAMGQTTGGPLRAMLAEAGLPVFASPEQAVYGFLHLVRDRRNRAAARELPDSAVLPLAPDRESVKRVLGAARGALSAKDASIVYAAYGIVMAPETPIAVFEDAVFGPIIALGRERAMDLPPLNLTLAHALIARAHLPDAPELAENLVRVSQLVVDFPEIAAIDTAANSLVLRRLGEAPARLAIAPYPGELAEPWTSGNERLTIRPIRPEDAEAHGAFFKRLSPTDVRFRFFSAMRELSPERTARLTQVDYEREMAFIAIREATQETVGVARLVSDTEGSSCEFAVIVQSDMKGHGLASHLMHRLIAWARDRGLQEVVGQILSDNAPMLAFIRHLGFTVHRLPDDPEVMEARLSLL